MNFGRVNPVYWAVLIPGLAGAPGVAGAAEGARWWGPAWQGGGNLLAAAMPRPISVLSTYLLCAAGLALAGYGGYRWMVRWRRRMKQQRDQEVFKLVDEWTKSLQQEVLERKQAQKALVESQEIVMRQERLAAVGQMAAGVAHEFNNILTVIQGHATLLLDNPSLDEESVKSLRQIVSGVDRTAKLIRQMLAFSRKQVMQREALDLNLIATSATDLLGPLLGESIEVRRILARDPLHVLADATMIEQIVFNLAVNSRDAMPQGGELTISTCEMEVSEEEARAKAERHAGKFARLSVADTGCGMDAAVIDHLFEPFFTTKEVGKGVGLGLATVYGMVKQHQGWIEVESQPGKGACFHINLPLIEKPAEKPLESAPFSSVRGGKEIILVVEDEEALRELVREILECQGYHVLEAASGVEALRVWEAQGRKVDLLLSDIVMPEGMSGRELAGKLQEADPSLPVILTSGYSQDMIERDSVLDERIRFFSKPYHPAQLAQAVRETLDARKRNGDRVKDVATPG